MIIDQFISEKFSEKGRKKFANEKLSRSIVKAVSWRILGTIDTIILSYFITSKMSFAISIGLAELVTKLVLYVIHERIWNKISWQKETKK